MLIHDLFTLGLAIPIARVFMAVADVQGALIGNPPSAFHTTTPETVPERVALTIVNAGAGKPALRLPKSLVSQAFGFETFSNTAVC